jgi:hypothetical protein
VPLKFFYHLLPLQAIYFHTFPHYMWDITKNQLRQVKANGGISHLVHDINFKWLSKSVLLDIKFLISAEHSYFWRQFSMNWTWQLHKTLKFIEFIFLN